jgi:DNA/RNA endonuclease YhcR with UshA esterase domain
MSRWIGFGLLFAFAGILSPVSAHHSLASEFDINKTIVLTGTVSKVEWKNPHGRIFMDVKDATGAVATWELEQGSVNGLMRNGWTRNTVKPGDVITVNGLLARDTPHIAAVSNAPASITLADGRTYLPGQRLPPAPTR